MHPTGSQAARRLGPDRRLEQQPGAPHLRRGHHPRRGHRCCRLQRRQRSRRQRAAQLPGGLAATSDGAYLIADNDNNRIRRVSPERHHHDGGRHRAPRAFGGDGGPATSRAAERSLRRRLAPGRRLPDRRPAEPPGPARLAHGHDHHGRGHGTAGFTGDGGPATAATLNKPINLAATIGRRLPGHRPDQQPDSQGVPVGHDQHRGRHRHRRASPATAVRPPPPGSTSRSAST